MCKFRSHLPGFCAGRDTAQSVVAPLIVVVVPKSQQLPLQVASSPKGHGVEKVPPECPYEPFHEGVRERCIGHGLDFRDLDNSKVGLSSMKLEQRIMIAAEISGVPPLRIALLNVRQTDGPPTTPKYVPQNQ